MVSSDSESRRVNLSSRILSVLVGCIVVLTFVCTSAEAQTSVAPVKGASHDPHQVAGYVLPGGKIQIVTASSMASVIRGLNELFISTHPGVRFSVVEGDNYSVMATLTFDRTLVGPLGCEYTRIGLGDNLKIAAEPEGFRLAHATLSPGSGVPALGVIVNSANPLSSLSMTQLTRMFAIGGPGGDIATWGQAGVTGPLADRPVRPVGPPASDYMDSDDPQAGEFLSNKMNGLNMNHSYQALPRYQDIVRRVSEDPTAVGITALNVPMQGVKSIALKGTEAGSAVLGTAESIGTGRYPLDRYVYLYLRVGKGMPLDELAREYVQTSLSAEGQRIVAAAPAGYLPLNEEELAEERGKLQR